MLEYHFNAELARRYSVDGAIFLHSMAFWVAKNRANERHLYEGRYWTYNTLEALTELFPFWSRRQLERIVNKLKDEGALLTGNFSKDKTDRTRWYALSDSVLAIYGEAVFPISPNGEMDFTESGQSCPDSVKCDKDSSACQGEAMPPISPNGEMDFTKPGQPCHDSVKCNKDTVTYQIDTPYSPPEKRRRERKTEVPEDSRAILSAYCAGKPELKEALEQFVSVRLENKKAKHSPAAYKAILGRLDRYSGGSDEVKVDMLSLAASGAWITVYPPKPGDKPKQGGEEDFWAHVE